MHPLRQSTRRAFRRSRKLIEALEALDRESGPLDAIALASKLRMSPGRLYAMMRGWPPHYRRGQAPLSLGLARESATVLGPAFTITHRGREDLARLRTIRAHSIPV